MPGETLRVLARGRSLVPDYERAQNDKRNAFVGWSCQAAGAEMRDEQTGQTVTQAVFVKKIGVVCEVPLRAEYLRELRDGCLWPADLATAQLANVKFDPAFGGEHDDAKRDEQKAELDSVKPKKGK